MFERKSSDSLSTLFNGRLSSMMILAGFSLFGFALPLKALAAGIEYNLGLGIRDDSLNWNIAGDANGQNPNVLSELTWDDIRLAVLSAGLKVPLFELRGRSLFVKGEGSYGWIYDGDNQDRDFAADNRQQEVSRSNNQADDGNALKFSVGLGIDLETSDRRWRFSPGVGYAYQELNLVLQDGRQTIPNSGPIAGLDSTYDARWDHLWAGVDVNYRFSQKVHFGGSIQYQESDYQADANWNLRTDLQHPVSFRQVADGDGLSLNVTGYYLITPDSKISLGVDYGHWSSDPGSDRVFFTNGTTQAVRLNEVEWSSRSITLSWESAF